MTNPSLSRARRIAGAVLVVATLGAGASTVVPSTPVAAAPSPAAPNVVGLRKGARGDAVKALQEALVRVGVGVKYGVDSYFGSATEASVKAFQRIKGISITGVVDAATAAALGLATAPAPAAPSAPAAGAGDRPPRPRLHRAARRPGAAGADQLRLPHPQRRRRDLRCEHRASTQGVPEGERARRERPDIPVDDARPRRRRGGPRLPRRHRRCRARCHGRFAGHRPARSWLDRHSGRPGPAGTHQARLPHRCRRRLRRHHRARPDGIPTSQRARRQRPDVPGDDARPRRHGRDRRCSGCHARRDRHHRRRLRRLRRTWRPGRGTATGPDQRRHPRARRGGRRVRVRDRQRGDGVPAGEGLEGVRQGRRRDGRRARPRRRRGAGSDRGRVRSSSKPSRCRARATTATAGTPPAAPAASISASTSWRPRATRSTLRSRAR